MWLLSDFLKMNLFCYIIYKSDTCTLHVFRIFSELVTSDVSAHRDDEKEIVTGSQSFMKLFFYYFDSFINLNLLGYYGIIYI
jgi:hypothetical protein